LPGAAIPAAYFDGRHATRRDVSLSIDAGHLTVIGGGVDRRESLNEVDITEPLGDAPRLLRFADGAFCSVEDRGRLAALLAAHGVRPANVSQWEGSLRWIAIAAATFLFALAAGYYYMVPMMAGAAAGYVPSSMIEVISNQSLSALDSGVFEATEVPQTRQDGLARRMSSLRFPADSHPGSYRILFRKSVVLGPNAMALPSGAIVVTDALVALTPDDDELMAVLAHEAGHVERRHGLRQVLQNSTVALAVTWLLGDISILAAAAPTALLQARYSRDLEREADRHAIEVLDLNGIPRGRFVRILERLDAAAREMGASDGASLLDYLSSHPVTRERVEAIDPP
jgi:Zn-dependent protease with chaperone function